MSVVLLATKKHLFSADIFISDDGHINLCLSFANKTSINQF